MVIRVPQAGLLVLPAEPEPDQAALNRRRLGAQHGDRDGIVAAGSEIVLLGDMMQEIVIFVTEDVGGPAENIADAGVVVLFEQRDEFMTHPVAEKPVIPVGRIFAPGKLIGAQVSDHLVAADAEQRSHHAQATDLPIRPDPDQPRHAGAADESQEKRLDLVIRRVAKDDFGNTGAGGDALEKIESRGSRRVLGLIRQRTALDGGRKFKLFGQVPHERRIGLAVGTAPTVVKVTDMRSPTEPDQQLKQGDGVRPAGDTGEDGLAGRQQLVEGGLDGR